MTGDIDARPEAKVWAPALAVCSGMECVRTGVSTHLHLIHQVTQDLRRFRTVDRSTTLATFHPRELDLTRHPLRSDAPAADREPAHGTRPGFWRRVSRAPIHPVFWVTFPILALWSQNAAETPAGVVIGLLWKAALMAAVATVLFSVPLRDPKRGALVVVTILVPTMLYGYVFTDPDGRLGLVVWGAIVAAGLLTVLRLKADVLPALTAAMNGVALVLVLLNGIPAGLGAWDRHQALSQPIEPVEPAVQPAEDLPDIWYLVPDRYSRQDTLAAYEGIDNAPFVASLRDRGFQVFDRAATNYPTSMLSLTGSLNLRYLHDIDDVTGDDRALAARALLNDHELGRMVTRAGYEYVHLGSWADFSASAARAHRVLTSESAFAFDVELARLTVVPALQSLLSGGVGEGTGLTRRRIQRIHGEHQVRVLRQLAATDPDHPQLVFAHLIFPHGPFVFDADGSLLDDRLFTGDNRSEGLRRQMAFTNDFLLDIVDVLQAREDPPIVIIQSDEGELPPDFFDTDEIPWLEFGDDEHRMHNAIFSAVFVPNARLGIDEQEPITAVNILRATISLALGEPLERLEDVSYAFHDEHLGDYRDVTDLAFSSP